MRTTARGVAVTITVTAAAAVLAGCTDNAFAERSAGSIAKVAAEEMAALDSVRMIGSIDSPEGELEIDLAADRSGRCTGSITIDGARARFVSTGKAYFLQPDRAFWEAQGATGPALDRIMSTVGDKWARVPPGTSGFDDFCDITGLLDSFAEDSEKKLTSTKGEQVDVGDIPTIEVSQKKRGETTTAWVSLEEPHHVVKLESEDGDQPGTVYFSDFDREVDVDAPSGNEVVDLDSL
jgi:hypothetical protein